MNEKFTKLLKLILIVSFKGETLRKKVGSKNFNKSLVIHQICQSLPIKISGKT